jgi:subtilisin family serine protease
MRRWAAAAIAIASLALPAAAAAFGNLEPLASHQWYLDNDRAWTFWPMQPQLFPVSVAVIDSGIDGTHPEFVGRVVAAKSFVGGSRARSLRAPSTTRGSRGWPSTPG